MEKRTETEYTVKSSGIIEVKIITFITDGETEYPPINFRDTIVKGDWTKAEKYGLKDKLTEDWK